MLSNAKLKLKLFNDSIQYTYFYLPGDFSSYLYTSDDKEIQRISSSRTKSLIKDYVKSNEFDYFVTITIKDSKRYNISYSVDLLNNAIINYKKQALRRGKDFKYIYVYELTKQGGVHLHGFFKGFYDIYINDYCHKSSLYFDNIGFQNFLDAGRVNEFYLIKYISKEPIKELKHKFFRSRNLQKPDIDYIDDNLKEFNIFSYRFANNYCKMVTIEK